MMQSFSFKFATTRPIVWGLKVQNDSTNFLGFIPPKYAIVMEASQAALSECHATWKRSSCAHADFFFLYAVVARNHNKIALFASYGAYNRFGDNDCTKAVFSPNFVSFFV